MISAIQGIGMGLRYYYNKKATANESCDLDIYRLRKQGMLSGCKSTTITWVMSFSGKESSIGLTVNMTVEEPYAQFNYTTTNNSGDSIDHEYRAYLVSTNCNYGGVRWWFVCPDCNRRVGVLYIAPGGTRFSCRHCNNLTYLSRNRCVIASFGHTSREIDRLRSEIKRWTWRGRPTRKVRRLQALQWKMRGLGMAVSQRTDRMFARLR